MITVALIAPGRSEGQAPGAAAFIYNNPLAQARLQYARQSLRLRDEQIFFISPRYGLLGLDALIRPGDEDIRLMNAENKAQWAHRVKRDLRQKFMTLGRVVFLAGSHYQKPLVEMLKGIRLTVDIPCLGMEVTQQIEFLTATNAL